MEVTVPDQERIAEIRRIVVWVCDECGYWRQERSSGVHQTTNPNDPCGRMVWHPLRKATFVDEAALDIEDALADAAATGEADAFWTQEELDAIKDRVRETKRLLGWDAATGEGETP